MTRQSACRRFSSTSVTWRNRGSSTGRWRETSVDLVASQARAKRRKGGLGRLARASPARTPIRDSSRAPRDAAGSASTSKRHRSVREYAGTPENGCLTMGPIVESFSQFCPAWGTPLGVIGDGLGLLLSASTWPKAEEGGRPADARIVAAATAAWRLLPTAAALSWTASRTSAGGKEATTSASGSWARFRSWPFQLERRKATVPGARSAMHGCS